jgi:hypothetical protein
MSEPISLLALAKDFDGWKSRAIKAEAEVERLTKERDEARAQREKAAKAKHADTCPASVPDFHWPKCNCRVAGPASDAPGEKP